MKEQNRYSYASLGDNEMRLIRFLRHDADTVADLRVFPITDELPPYCALSYAWKSEDAGLDIDHAIEISGQRLPILASVHSFVEALRSRRALPNNTWWWIDSICIDQNNLEERSQQVGSMQQIYREAHQCIVWLGAKSYDSREAMNLIRALGNVNFHGRDDISIRPMLESRFRNRAKHWAALERLFMRKWWTRIWTIQEFVIPHNVTLWCGSQSVSRTVVCRALMTADRCPWSQFKETLGFRYGFNRRRLWMLYKTSNKPPGKDVTFSLAALAAYFSISDATDDRDRLYGLRALSTDGGLLDVSYEHIYQDIYTRYAQAFINRHKSLDIICFSSVYTHTPPPADPPVPSWVPDWRQHMGNLVLPLMVSQGSQPHIGNMRPPVHLDSDSSEEPAMYSASGSKQAGYTFDGRILCARGILIDSIDGLAESTKSPPVQSSHPNNLSTQYAKGNANTPAETLLSICKALTMDRKNRYLQYAMPRETYFKDFMRLCSLCLTASLDSTAVLLQEWFDRSRSFQIRGRTLEDTLRAGMEELGAGFMDKSGPPPSQVEFVHDSFFGRFIDAVTRMLKRLMVSCGGHIGLAPEHAQKGDLLCILYGCSVPVVLRRSGDDDRDRFIVVGECFIDGYMEGQGVEEGAVHAERIFQIS